MEKIKYEDFFSGYELDYCKKYGIGALIPRLWSPVKEKDRERVYKKALDEGKTWQEAIGYERDPDLIL